jgi:hypothetical protein
MTDDTRSNPRVELIYDADCPNVERARAALRQALTALGAREEWREWNRGSPETPESVRRFGSPTVLVNGRDVGGDDGSAAADRSCRIYADASGRVSGVPSPQLILAAIAAESAP